MLLDNVIARVQKLYILPNPNSDSPLLRNNIRYSYHDVVRLSIRAINQNISRVVCDACR